MEANLHITLPDARIEWVHPPGLKRIVLGLINDDYQTGPLAPEVMHAVIANPAYWAFCWGSGLATAQWLLENPNIVANKTVIDLGSGSGIVAIAAALAGAKSVCVCDNDPFALHASLTNALCNEVEVSSALDLSELPKCDVLFMADVLYDRSNFPLIQLAKQFCRKLIIADSRISDVEDPAFTQTHTIEALTFPNLGEFEEFRTVSFFQWLHASD